MTYKHKVTEKTIDSYVVEVEMPYDSLDSYKEKSFARLSKNVKIQGFRPGKAPRALIESKIGEDLLQDALKSMLVSTSFEIIEKESFRPILQPEYHMDMFDKEKGIKFHFHFVNYPEVKLPKFESIKVEKNVITVKDEDTLEIVKSVIRSNLKEEQISEHSKIIKPIVEDKKTDDKDKKVRKSSAPIDFEVNDKLVELLGYPEEKTVDQIKERVKSYLQDANNNRSEQELESKIVEKLIVASTFELPKMLIENELIAVKSSFESRLKELNLDIDAYLSSIGKKKEDVEKEWDEEAKRRVSIDVILSTIAMENKLIPTDAHVQSEVDKITDKTERAQYQTVRGMDYIRMVLTRRRALDFVRELVKIEEKQIEEKKIAEKKESKKTKKEEK